MAYKYTPTHFNAVSLTAAPYRKVWFRAANSPVDMPRRVGQVEADVVGLGPQDVRAQPRGQTFELHVDLDGETEAKYQTFKRDFSPNLGLVFLRADGNDQYVALKGQLSHYLEDPYMPRTEREPKTDHVTVAFIGGGFAGLVTGARITEAGIKDVRIIEKGGDFGGTWYWNRYP